MPVKKEPSPGRGERIRQRRIARGLSQQQVADMCLTHQTAISKLEKDEIEDPGISFLTKVAAALETTLDYLQYGIGAENFTDTPPTPQSTIVAEIADMTPQELRGLKAAIDAIKATRGTD